MTLYLQRIRGNVKCGIFDLNSNWGTDAYLTLGQKTLIYGANGSGKSTIINGVELLLGGFASDVMGRSLVRSPQHLISLKGPKDPKATLQVKGIMSDNTIISYELRKTEKGAGRPRHNGPSGLTIQFPMQEVQSILRGSVDTTRQWLCSKLAIEEYIEVNDDLRTEIYAQKKADPNAPISDILQNIQDTASRKIKEAKSSIKASELAKNKLGAISTPIEEHILEQMKVDCDNIFQEIISQSKSVQSGEIGKLEDMLSFMRSKYDKCVTRLQQLSNLQPLSAVEREQVTILTHLREVAKLNRERENCFVCDNKLTKKALTVGQVEGILVSVGQRLTDTNERDSLLKQRQVLEEQIQNHVSKLDSMKALCKPTNIDDLQRRYTTAQKKYEDLKIQHKTYTVALELDADIKKNSSIVKEQEKVLHHAKFQFSEALGQAVAGFQNRVNQYLRDSYEFIMELTDTTCKVGLQKYGEHCFAVSGAEWIMLCMAIAAATTFSHEKILNVYVIEDRDLDEENLHVLMDLMKNIDGQVLMTTTLKPKLQIPNWLYIERYDIPF